MKKLEFYLLAIIILLAAALSGCVNEKAKSETDILDSREWTEYKTYGHYIEVVVIDSCEYLYSYNHNATWCTHKGNCKFCAARNNR